MGPDNETLAAGQVFWAPPGTELPTAENAGEWNPLGDLTAEFPALGEAAVAASDAVYSYAEASTVSFEVEVNWTPDTHRMFFRWRKPKWWRKRFDRHHTQIKKRARAEFRTAQRRAIGIAEKR